MNGGHYFNSVAKEQVLAVLEKNGMLPPDKTYERVVKNKIALGQKLWDTVIGDAIGQELREFCETSIKERGRFYHIEHIPRYAAFGHDIADCFCRLFGVSENTASDIAAAGALLNSYAALFDKICDDYTELRPHLMRRCSPEILSRAASLTLSDTKPFFRLKENDAPLVKIVVLLIREYFNRCAAILDCSGGDKIRAEFQNTVSLLYKSELTSINLTFAARMSGKSVYKILRNKSSLLIWLLVLPCLSPPARKCGGKLSRLKEAVLDLGDVFWILDDIVDSSEDLSCVRWGYPTLQFTGRVFLENRDCASILDDMLNRGIISSAAENMCIKYRNAKRELEKMTHNIVDFDKIFLPWFRMWIDSTGCAYFRE
jgi:hypothetical protein